MSDTPGRTSAAACCMSALRMVGWGWMGAQAAGHSSAVTLLVKALPLPLLLVPGAMLWVCNSQVPLLLAAVQYPNGAVA